MLTEKQKKIAGQIWNEIKKAERVLLHCHPSPDPDSVGSALAMMLALQGMGKDVTVIEGDSEKPPVMAHLPGFEMIEPKNYFEIDAKEFDLFLILDSSDLSQVSKLNEVVFPETLVTVNIDHHGYDRGYADIDLVIKDSPAVAQILFDLFRLWKVVVTPDMAVNLILGIYADTGGFKYPLTVQETFKIAGELASISPDYHQVIFEYENDNEPEIVLFKGLALSSINMYFDGKVAIAEVPYKELKKRGIVKRHTEKSEISNMLKSVVGWEIGIAFVEIEPNEVSISMRTRGKYDVGKIAVATGNGGGHALASGATLFKPYEDAKTFLLDTIVKVYPELGEP